MALIQTTPTCCCPGNRNPVLTETTKEQVLRRLRLLRKHHWWLDEQLVNNLPTPIKKGSDKLKCTFKAEECTLYCGYGNFVEICLFILVSVYIPLHTNARSAVKKLADQITETEQKHPDSVLIILRHFNKANLSRELPKYRHHVTCPTRDSNILDHCYTTIKEAYRSVPQDSFKTL